MNSFKQPDIFITGPAGDVGKKLALKFAEKGRAVWLEGENQDEIDALSNENSNIFGRNIDLFESGNGDILYGKADSLVASRKKSEIQKNILDFPSKKTEKAVIFHAASVDTDAVENEEDEKRLIHAQTGYVRCLIGSLIQNPSKYEGRTLLILKNNKPISEDACLESEKHESSHADIQAKIMKCIQESREALKNAGVDIHIIHFNEANPAKGPVQYEKILDNYNESSKEPMEYHLFLEHLEGCIQPFKGSEGQPSLEKEDIATFLFKKISFWASNKLDDK